MKKITAIIMSLLMLGQTVFASVYDEWLYGTDVKTEQSATSVNTSYSDSIDILDGLGLLDGLYFKPSKGTVMTRGDFLGMVMHIDNLGVYGEISGEIKFSDVTLADGYAYAVYEALRREIINGTSENSFHPDEPLSYAAAQKILVNVLGYKLIAESKGGYPTGYTSLSASLDLDIKPENLNSLKSEEAAAMVVAALEASYNNTTIEMMFSKNNDENLSWLEYKYDIVKYSGIVDGTKQSSLYEINGTGENSVSIDGLLYETDFDFIDYLGKSVYYYLKNDEVVVYAYETKKNETLVIDSEDIAGVVDRKIEYYDGSKLKSVEIPKTASVIYNNICFPNYKMEDINIDSGKLELISNANNSQYTIVKVSEFTPMIVNAVDVENELIYASVRDSGSNTPKAKSISFDINEYDMFEIYNQGGELIEIKDVKEGTVLNMLLAKNKKCAKIYIGGGQSSGVVEEIIDDGKPCIVVNANKLELSEVSMIDISEFKTGSDITVFTDMFGKVIYAKLQSYKETEYAYLISVHMVDDNETAFLFKVYDREGMLKKIKSSEKFYLNDEKISDFSVVPDALKESTAILYKLDEYGQVQKIYTPDNDKSPLKSVCADVSEKLFYTGGNNFKFATSAGFDASSFCVDENTVMLSIPDDAKTAEDKYFGVLNPTKFTQFESHHVQAYTQNENSNIAEFVISHKATGTLSVSKDAAIITDITTGINSNDEVVAILTLTGYSFREKKFATSSIDIAKNIPFSSNDKSLTVTDAEIGDLIVYSTNNMDEIQEITIVAKAIAPGEDLKYWTKAAYNGAWYSNLAIYRGYLNNVKNSIGEFELYDDPSKKFTFKVHDSLVIVCVDKNATRDAERIEFMDAKALASFENSGIKNDTLLYVKTSTPRIMIIYK